MLHFLIYMGKMSEKVSALDDYELFLQRKSDDEDLASFAAMVANCLDEPSNNIVDDETITVQEESEALPGHVDSGTPLRLEALEHQQLENSPDSTVDSWKLSFLSSFNIVSYSSQALVILMR